MSRSLGIASFVGGMVLARGMLLILFSADAAAWSVTGDGDVAETVEVGGDRGTLVGHYLSGPRNLAFESPATDPTWMAAAGVVVAALGGWTLRQTGKASSPGF